MPSLSVVLSNRIKAILIFFALAIMIFVLWRLLAPRAWQDRTRIYLESKPVSVVAQPGQKLLTTDCNALVLPEDFDWRVESDTCRFSAYSRPRKHVYVTLNTYTREQVKGAEADWKNRWESLGAELSSREQVQWGGKSAEKFIEYYPQNNESMVTYLLTLTDELPLKSSVRLKQFELRAWYTSQSDREVIDATVRGWQWRY